MITRMIRLADAQAAIREESAAEFMDQLAAAIGIKEVVQNE